MHKMFFIKSYFIDFDIFFLLTRCAIELAIIYFLFHFRFKIKNRELILNEELMEQIISDFKPDPIVDDVVYDDSNFHEYLNSDIIEVADYDFYNLANKNKVEMIEVLREYGVGTCGPPGFYGTLDLHIDLEEKISNVLGTEATILYSNAYTCINSVITCFCRQYDVIFYHQDCSAAIIRAIGITKSSTVEFNNLDFLESKISKLNIKNTRKFIITEGMFKNTGQITNMTRLLSIKRKYKARIILDETLSIPLLGSQGISTYFNTDIKEIDVLIGSLAHVFCGNGGFSTGTKTAVDFQRLNAKSYCFSASLPGFLAMNAMKNLEETYEQINTNEFIDNFHSKTYSIISDKDSPMIVLRNELLKDKENYNKNEELKKLLAVKEMLLDVGIRVGIIHSYFPAIRICLKQDLKENEIKNITYKVLECLNK